MDSFSFSFYFFFFVTFGWMDFWYRRGFTPFDQSNSPRVVAQKKITLRRHISSIVNIRIISPPPLYILILSSGSFVFCFVGATLGDIVIIVVPFLLSDNCERM